MSQILQENIKRKLKKQKLSIAELERRTGLRHSVINIMHGRSKNPSAKTTLAIAKELGCSIEELLTEQNYDSTNYLLDDSCKYAKNNFTNLNNEYNQSHSENKRNPKLEKDFTPTKQDTPWEAELSLNTLTSIQAFLSKHKLNPSMIELMNCWLEIYNYCHGTESKTVDERFVNWFMERNFLPLKIF